MEDINLKARTGRPPGLPKTGGRQRGTPNKITVEARAACALIVDDPGYRAKLTSRAKAGILPPAMEVLLWHYAKGRPKELVEVSASLQMQAISSDGLARLTTEQLQLLMEINRITDDDPLTLSEGPNQK